MRLIRPWNKLNILHCQIQILLTWTFAWSIDMSHLSCQNLNIFLLFQLLSLGSYQLSLLLNYLFSLWLSFSLLRIAFVLVSDVIYSCLRYLSFSVFTLICLSNSFYSLAISLICCLKTGLSIAKGLWYYARWERFWRGAYISNTTKVNKIKLQ